MLTKPQQFSLSLIRRSLGINDDLICDLTAEDTDEIIRIIQKNGIMLTVYRASPESIRSQLEAKYLPSVKQSILHDYEGKAVLSSLSNNGLNCIALKGWELRKLYPDITMRQMADLDILVRPYEFRKIRSVMQDLGFRSGSESSWKHDTFRKDTVTVEMHKRLTDDSAIVQKWEQSIWKRAKQVEGHIYKMSNEDFYIFHFVHLHKDFMNGSLGLRRIIDTWLLQKQKLNTRFVRGSLDKMGLLLFHDRMVRLSKVCMGEAKLDKNSEFLLKHAFENGIYGNDKSYKAGRIAAMSKGSMRFGKLRSLLAAVFLPYSRMKAQFPILKKYPVLLPYCWCKRIVHFLRGNVKKHKRRLDYRNISKADYKEMKQFFTAGGIEL